MSAKLKDLVRQIDSRQMWLVAGERGMNRSVDWVHMVGSVEIADFLTGGEVAFTTGVGLREDMTLLMLVERVFCNHASGMVINVGPYIPEIPKEVIDFGNANDFPVFEVPWDVHMADIMRVFCFSIQQSQQRTMEISAAFRYAIFTPEKEELYIPALLQRGFQRDWNYTAVLMEFSEYSQQPGNDTRIYLPVPQERFSVLQKRVADFAESEKTDTVIFSDNSRIVIIFGNIGEKEVCSQMEQLGYRIRPYLKNGETFFVGIGNTVNEVGKLAGSYQTARKLEEYFRIGKEEQKITGFGSLGLLGLLVHVNNREYMEEYYQRTVGRLEEWDNANGTNLTEVLECYLKYNGSVQSVADELYIHRNTVNYKLKKIGQILNTDLVSFDVRNELSAGLIAARLRLIG